MKNSILLDPLFLKTIRVLKSCQNTDQFDTCLTFFKLVKKQLTHYNDFDLQLANMYFIKHAYWEGFIDNKNIACIEK